MFKPITIVIHRNSPSYLIFSLVHLTLLLFLFFSCKNSTKKLEKWDKKKDKVPRRLRVVLMNFANTVISWRML